MYYNPFNVNRDVSSEIQQKHQRENPNEVDGGHSDLVGINFMNNSTNKLVPAVSGESSNVISNRLHRHTRVISQPVYESDGVRKSLDVIYCDEEAIDSQALPPLTESQVLATFNKIKKLGPSRPRPQSWAPECPQDQDNFYYSLISVEVSDVSEVYIREPKNFDSQDENCSSQILNKYERVMGISAKQQHNSKSETLVMHPDEQFGEHLPIAHLTKEDKEDKPLESHNEDAKDEIEEHQVRQDRQDRETLQNSENNQMTRGLITLKKIETREENNIDWFQSPIREQRSDSLSTNDRFSCSHFKNNGEDFLTTRLRSLERGLITPECDELVQDLFKGN